MGLWHLQTHSGPPLLKNLCRVSHLNLQEHSCYMFYVLSLNEIPNASHTFNYLK